MKESGEIITKNNNEIDLPKIINSEVNLLVFPFLNKYIFDKLPLREISNKYK